MSSNHLKVLHVSSAKTWRGGEQQLAYLVSELASRDVDQWVLCVKNSQLEHYCEKNKIPFYSYYKYFSSNPLVGLKINSICRKHSIKIIHTHDSHGHTFSWIAALFSKLSRKVFPGLIVSRRVDFKIKGKRKYNFQGISKIICVSDFVRRVMEPEIRKKEKLEVVYDGIDLRKFKFSKKQILHKKYNIPKEIPLIANIAAIAPHKDYFTFIDTVKVLVDKGIKAKFLIIGGDGGEQREIENYIEEKKLSNHIILTGFLNNIPEIFPEVDILLFTSKTEGLGTTILDAFTCGVPVVATAGGGIPELITHQETGLLCDVGDSSELAVQVIRLIKDSNLAKEIKKNASEKVKSFSKALMAERTLNIYIDSLNEKKST